MLVAMLASVLLVGLLASGVNLTSHVSTITGAFFTLLTDSAGKGFIVSLAVFSLLALRLGISREKLFSRAIQLAVILVIGFAGKTGLKHFTESPRPYTAFLANELVIPQPAHFYQLAKAQKKQVIESVEGKVSSWRIHSWLKGMNYSFPSGHTIFAAICIALFGGLFLEYKRYLMAGGTLLWAAGVEYSRLWMGMHRVEDLLGSVLFVAAVYFLMPSFSQIALKLLAKLPAKCPVACRK